MPSTTRTASPKDPDIEQAESTTAHKRIATPRRRARRSRSLRAEAERRVIRPAKSAVKSASQDISERVSSLPAWVPWVAGAIGAGALIYGLFQTGVVRDFIRTVTEPFDESFSDEDEFGEDEFEDENTGSDYGSNTTLSGL